MTRLKYAVFSLITYYDIDIIHPLPKVCNPLTALQGLIYVIEVKSQKIVPMSCHFDMTAI